MEVSRAWHVACGKVSPFITFNYHDTSGIYLLGDQVWGGSTFPQTCASLDPVTCFETQLLRVLHQEREKSEEIKPLADIDPCYKVHLPVYGNNYIVYSSAITAYCIWRGRSASLTDKTMSLLETREGHDLAVTRG